MKRIVVTLKDEEWKEVCDTIRHEFGEPLTDDDIKKMVKDDILDFIRENYIRGLQ